MNRLRNLGLATILAIGVTGAALAAGGTSKTVTGNLEDTYCYGTMMAGSLIAVLPLAVMFLIMQRRFIESVATTGLK